MQSLETMNLQLAYKPKYPVNFFLLRGNYVCASVMHIYGFYNECKCRFNIKTWKQFCDVFNYFPLCGLSPEISIMDQVRCLERPLNVTDTGIIHDLLWDDLAMDIPDSGVVYDWLWADLAQDITGWAEDDRSVSLVFRPDADWIRTSGASASGRRG